MTAYRYIAREGNWDVISEKLLKLFNGDVEDDEEFATTFQQETDTHVSTCEVETTNQKPMKKLLVLVIDEARSLLPREGDKGRFSWFRAMRRALSYASNRISTEFGDGAGIFAVLVDTNSKISNFVPSAPDDSSQRLGEVRLFPPSVLTESMDLCFHEGDRLSRAALVEKYKTGISQALASGGTNWNSLRFMGRPLWLRCAARDLIELTELAATKLLGGVSRLTLEQFKDANLFGVSSVLCRVGFRPSAHSPLASRSVAEFMAVLAYIGFENNRILCSYSSDPVLSLGATLLWHRFPNGLALKILPQLRQTLHQEVMDTGGAGEMVARIVLLLAMDACGVLRTGDEASRWKEAGEFSSVWTFLTALHGESPTVRPPVVNPPHSTSVPSTPTKKKPTKAVTPTIGATLKAVQSRWKSWYVSFTQFVQLAEEPTEACLWAMLGRRVAGILPRGQNGADLVIPIVKKGVSGGGLGLGLGLGVSVSMILVQVKNIESRDSTITKSATANMDPDFVFKNPTLGALKPHQVMRIYMSLRGYKRPATSYAVDKRSNGVISHTLCMCGLRGWSSRLDPTGSSVEVVSEAVVKELQPLLGPWWTVMDAVETDLDKRDGEHVFGISKEELMESAANTLAETVLLNDAEEFNPTEDARGTTPFEMTGMRSAVSNTTQGSDDDDEEMEDDSSPHEDEGSTNVAAEGKLTARRRKDSGSGGGRQPKVSRLA